jgi:hypothetical protein
MVSDSPNSWTFKSAHYLLACSLVVSLTFTLHLQMRCKITTNNNSLQISTLVACKFLLRNRHIRVKKH